MSCGKMQQQQQQETATTKKVKGPCCVCKDERRVRDECFLLNGKDSSECDAVWDSYAKCLQKYGFEANR
ncbi:MAG: hypothetical protein MHM6MM_002337 [Cercozoa sp. M6MM]